MVNRPSRTVVGSREPVDLLCPRCGWAITLKTRWLTIRHCPRCVAHGRVTVQLVRSATAEPEPRRRS